MPFVGKLQKVVRNGGTKIVCRWTVEFLAPEVEKGKTLFSEEFHFGPGVWCFFIKSNIGSSNVTEAVAEVLLKGPSQRKSNDSHFEGRISWKLSLMDKSAEGVWGEKDGYCIHHLPLGPLPEFWNLFQPSLSIKVLCELRIISEGNTDVSSQNLGDPEIVGTLVYSWIMPEFPVLARRGTRLSSPCFRFGRRLWQLHISPKIPEIPLSLERVSGSAATFPLSWELSVENDWGDVLKRIDGVYKGEELLHVASIGPLSDVQRFVESEWGALRVQCELRLPDGITYPPFSVETDAGTDILVQDFQRLLTSGESSDATIRVKAEREFRVHRSVLVARTPIFASMFRYQMSESATGIVNVEDCEPNTFEQFLQHVYTGTVEDLCPENALGLYQVADKYQVDDLKSMCLECVKRGMSVELFFPILKLALQHSEAELTQFAMEFFANKMQEIIVTVEWQQFIVENPIEGNELYVKALGAASTT